MPRDVVNALLDRIVDQREAVDRAVSKADKTKAGLKRAMRAALDRGATREQFRDVFVGSVLAHFAEEFPDIIKASRSNLEALVRAVNAAGRAKIKTIQALRKPDVMRRATERAGATNGEATPATGTAPNSDA